MIPVTYCFDFSLNESLRPYMFDMMAKNGIKNIVLTNFFIGKILSSTGYIDALKQETANCGLKFVDAHAVFGHNNDLVTPDKAKRNLMIRRELLTLEICAEMGVDTITKHVGFESNYEPNYWPVDQNVERIEDALSQLLPAAEKLGITICLENIWSSTNTPDVLMRIKKDFPTDALGICFDSGHANLCEKGYLHEGNNSVHRVLWQKIFNKEPDWDDQICEKLLPEIVTCHLHDNDGGKDQHCLPGKGNIDWDRISGLLKTAPKLKYIQSEVSVVTNNVSLSELRETFERMFPESK